jgi:beta-glucosidase/6-phospho-beta-glucosidase/beta-galactosidase
MVTNGDTGDVACDHYRRYKDDVKLMKELGMQAYRFSIAWARVLPEGKGRVNQGGLDFYSRLVDELLENGIEPLATLYHWDLPSALDDRGGWLNPDIADWFADYASVMYRKLDGRVKTWATLNEPWVVTDGGYLHGALAPGHRNRFEAPIASHHLLRSHGAAVRPVHAGADLRSHRAGVNHPVGAGGDQLVALAGEQQGVYLSLVSGEDVDLLARGDIVRFVRARQAERRVVRGRTNSISRSRLTH